MQYTLDISVQTVIGVYTYEKDAPQDLSLTITFALDTRAAMHSDDLQDTIDYAHIREVVLAFTKTSRCQLLEYFLFHLHKTLLDNFPQLENLTLTAEKFPFEKGSIKVQYP